MHRDVTRRVLRAPRAQAIDRIRRHIADPSDPLLARLVPANLDGLHYWESDSLEERIHEHYPMLASALERHGGLAAARSRALQLRNESERMVARWFCGHRAWVLVDDRRAPRPWADGPALVVSPHVGLSEALVGWLLMQGAKVTVFMAKRNWHDSTRWALTQGFFDLCRPPASARLRTVQTQGRGASLEILQAFREGHVVLWQPDVEPIAGPSRTAIITTFLGEPLRHEPVIARLVDLVRAPVMFMTATTPPDLTSLHVTIRDVPRGHITTAQTFHDHLFAEAQAAVLTDPRQWQLLASWVTDRAKRQTAVAANVSDD